MYPVVRIQSSRAEALEDLGTKAKFWYLDGDTRVLFKAEERGTGEDWAEKVSCELAALLGLPHVHYEMAHDVDQDRPGVVCASLAPPPLALAHGNQLLLALDPDYPDAQGPRYRSRAHTIDAVFDVVRRLSMPTAGWCVNLPEGIDDAAGVFVGYLMLDAWVANQDRHHENWGAVWDGQGLSLAPSFDHGAALARNLSDAERAERLASRDRHRQMAHFVRRARSALYADAVAPSPRRPCPRWRPGVLGPSAFRRPRGRGKSGSMVSRVKRWRTSWSRFSQSGCPRSAANSPPSCWPRTEGGYCDRRNHEHDRIHRMARRLGRTGRVVARGKAGTC